MNKDTTQAAQVVAVCISPGGVPKKPQEAVGVVEHGLVGDGHDHDKHNKPHRAVSIQDLELLEQINLAGFDLRPGTIGENLTVRGLNVQSRLPGDRLQFDEGGPILELTEPRKPCFVLDEVDPRLQDAVIGRCGFLARVISGGVLRPGQTIELLAPTKV